MTKLVLFILLSATATPAQARDTRNSLRDIMDFCNQFVINDPDPGFRFDYNHDCTAFDRDDPWR